MNTACIKFFCKKKFVYLNHNKIKNIANLVGKDVILGLEPKTQFYHQMEI